MGILGEKKKTTLSTSACTNLRKAYHDCFNKWYAEKFLKGKWNKEECVLEWQKYRDCLAKHLDDKHLSRFLETDGMEALTNLTDSTTRTGVS